MPAATIQTDFYGKTWIYQVGAFLSALLVVLCILIAILFVGGVLEPKGEIPPTVAASRLLLITLPMSLVTLLCWSNARARRQPLLRLCQEGLELNIVGRGSLDHVHGLPTSIKLAWLFYQCKDSESRLCGSPGSPIGVSWWLACPRGER
jgi:hypothetical protein